MHQTFKNYQDSKFQFWFLNFNCTIWKRTTFSFKNCSKVLFSWKVKYGSEHSVKPWMYYKHLTFQAFGGYKYPRSELFSITFEILAILRWNFARSNGTVYYRHTTCQGLPVWSLLLLSCSTWKSVSCPILLDWNSHSAAFKYRCLSVDPKRLSKGPRLQGHPH